MTNETVWCCRLIACEIDEAGIDELLWRLHVNRTITSLRQVASPREAFFACADMIGYAAQSPGVLPWCVGGYHAGARLKAEQHPCRPEV